MSKYAPLLGRLFISAIFIIAGIRKIMNFSGTEGYMKAYGLPLAALLLIGTIIVEIGGGLSVLLGWKAKWGALILVLFLIPTTIIFHTKFSDPNQMTAFLKNLAILGGLLFVAYFGSGPLSLDKKS